MRAAPVRHTGRSNAPHWQLLVLSQIPGHVDYWDCGRQASGSLNSVYKESGNRASCTIYRFCPTSLSYRHRPRAVDGNRERRLRPAKSRASNTRSPCRSHPGRPIPAPRWSTQPPFLFGAPAANPHRSTPASVRTPPRFPPSRLFGRLPVNRQAIGPRDRKRDPLPALARACPGSE
jgi:hypothetical protein